MHWYRVGRSEWRTKLRGEEALATILAEPFNIGSSMDESVLTGCQSCICLVLNHDQKHPGYLGNDGNISFSPCIFIIFHLVFFKNEFSQHICFYILKFIYFHLF